MMLVPPDESGMAAAVAALRRDEVVAYPTETVYGLAVNPFSPKAIRRLFAVKGRDADNPVLLIIAELEQLGDVSRDVSERAWAYAKRFWPGPLSLVVPKSDRVPLEVTAGRDNVSVRCPACAIARALCRAWGGPLTSTSANRSGEPPALSPDVLNLSGVAVILDGGQLTPSPPSTVYDPDTDTVFREGVISTAELRHSE